MPARTADDQTIIGVVIAIPEPHAAVLRRWRRRVGDPQAGLVWPHVTLLPPTPVTRSHLDGVRDHLRDAAADTEPFDMHLSGTGTFRPMSPVVFVQVAAGLASCEVLERAIRRHPVKRELDFPYHPHVTVAHGVPEPALDEVYDGLAGFTARFQVTSFQLFEQGPAGAWRQLAEFRLRPNVVEQPDGSPAAAARR